jgi:hypothetical protein
VIANTRKEQVIAPDIAPWKAGNVSGRDPRISPTALGSQILWSRWSDLNRRPAVYETAALPLSYTGDIASKCSTEIDELQPRIGDATAPCAIASAEQRCVAARADGSDPAERRTVLLKGAKKLMLGTAAACVALPTGWSLHVLQLSVPGVHRVVAEKVS